MALSNYEYAIEHLTAEGFKTVLPLIDEKAAEYWNNVDIPGWTRDKDGYINSGGSTKHKVIRREVGEWENYYG